VIATAADNGRAHDGTQDNDDALPHGASWALPALG
jgi:hypothetical protein